MTKVTGYRELTDVEKELMNELKEKGNELGVLMEYVQAYPNIEVDARAMATARTNIQTGMMWAIRSITKPDSFS